MTIHVSRKLKNANQRINALEKRVAELERMLKAVLTPPPLYPKLGNFIPVTEHWSFNASKHNS